MKWARRIVIASGMAAASLAVAPAVAGAACPNPYTCEPPTIAGNSTSVPPANAASSLPFSQPSSSPTTSSSSSSLPFTGADVAELAAIGTGAIVAGGLLMRRRRTANA